MQERKSMFVMVIGVGHGIVFRLNVKEMRKDREKRNPWVRTVLKRVKMIIFRR